MKESALHRLTAKFARGAKAIKDHVMQSEKQKGKRRTGVPPLPPKLIRMRALSIRQPYVEQIMRGEKRFEYRNRPTKIMGRVLIYASIGPGPASEFRKLRMEPGDLPTGLLMGTVEIVGCQGTVGNYKWKLSKPRRLRHPVPPLKHPQPVWFYPF